MLFFMLLLMSNLRTPRKGQPYVSNTYVVVVFMLLCLCRLLLFLALYPLLEYQGIVLCDSESKSPKCHTEVVFVFVIVDVVL